MAGALQHARQLLAIRIWEVRPGELPAAKAAAFRALRIGHAAVRGFLSHDLTVRAAALTYYSVLSLVPLLAFTFSVLKGFGAYQTFAAQTLRPWLLGTFSPNPALHEAVDRILGFVDRTDASRLGAVGLVLLVYAAISLVSSVEDALNRIFGARATRPLLRQVTDYVTLLVTTPLLVFAAATVSAAAQSSAAVEFLRDRLGLGALIDLVLDLSPVLAVGAGLFAMYLILPNVRVQARSALLGGALAALGWQGALVTQVKLQVGVANYNALYSVLGAIPIFLVWTYVSWLIVLVGAEVAASHQHEPAERQRLRGHPPDPALRETLALVLVARVTADFLAGAPRRGAAALAADAEVSPAVAEDVLEALVRAGVLARTVSGVDLAWVPGRDPGTLRVSDVADALRRDPGAAGARASFERRLPPGLRALAAALEGERRASPNDLTLRELAALAGPAAPAPAGDGPGAGELDAKQPRIR
ncbi:MAG: YihY/virulence factor BrkB family protein [Anaeromyxobacteraceae bacterium]